MINITWPDFLLAVSALIFFYVAFKTRSETHLAWGIGFVAFILLF